MRYLMLLFLLLGTYSSGQDLIQDNKKIIYYVTQNPIGAYYGDRVANFLAQTYPNHQVNTFYLNMDVGISDSNIKYLLGLISADIEKLKPDFVFVYNSGLTVALKQQLAGKFEVTDFSIMQSPHDVWLENPMVKLGKLLDSFSYEPDKYYILVDATNQSRRNATIYEKLFLDAGVKKDKISIIVVKDTRNLERELRRLNSEPRGIIVNAMYVLKDTELGKYNYLVDLKNIVVRVNSKHLDVSPNLSPYKNESVVVQINLAEAKRFFDSYILDIPADKRLVPFKIFINTERMDSLGLKDSYLKDLSFVDGVIKNG